MRLCFIESYKVCQSEEFARLKVCQSTSLANPSKIGICCPPRLAPQSSRFQRAVGESAQLISFHNRVATGQGTLARLSRKLMQINHRMAAFRRLQM